MDFSDHGKKPYVVDIEKLTEENETYRTAIWTGTNLQMTLMSIEVGEDIGLEAHPDNDQFLRIEQGRARVQMGDSKDALSFEAEAEDGSGIFIPAGTWHNITNISDEQVKIYSIYAPVRHPFGTVHETKAIAEEAEAHEHEHER